MKKVLLTIISVCLIAASIFGLFAGVSSFSDIMNVKEYKEKDAKEGLESIVIWWPSASMRRTRRSLCSAPPCSSQ